MWSPESHSANDPRICSLPAALQFCLWDEQLGLWPKLQIGIFLNQPFWEVFTQVLVTPVPWNLISVSFPLWGWSCLLGLFFPGPQFTSCRQTCSEDECWDHSCVSLLSSITDLQCQLFKAWKWVLYVFCLEGCWVYSIMAGTGSRFYPWNCPLLQSWKCILLYFNFIKIISHFLNGLYVYRLYF